MKFDFTERNFLSLESSPNWSSPVSWSKMLRCLKEESGCALYDDTFEQWVLKEWGIKFLHESVIFRSHLTGIELDESTLTMLLLKYSSN